jgi:hypothetical protein
VFDTGGFLDWEQYDRHYHEARLDEGETVSVHGTVRADGKELRAGRVGVRIAGRWTLVSDVDDGTMARRSLRAAAVSILLGVGRAGSAGVPPDRRLIRAAVTGYRRSSVGSAITGEGL